MICHIHGMSSRIHRSCNVDVERTSGSSGFPALLSSPPETARDAFPGEVLRVPWRKLLWNLSSGKLLWDPFAGEVHCLASYILLVQRDGGATLLTPSRE